MLYIVTRKSDNQEVYRYNADAPIEWSGMEFAEYDHTAWVDPSAPIESVAVRIWDPLQFMRRFTDEERKAIWAAQATNADIDDGIRLLMVATEVHSDDADVVRLTHAFEALGLIGVGRAAEILNG